MTRSEYKAIADLLWEARLKAGDLGLAPEHFALMGNIVSALAIADSLARNADDSVEVRDVPRLADSE